MSRNFFDDYASRWMTLKTVPTGAPALHGGLPLINPLTVSINRWEDEFKMDKPRTYKTRIDLPTEVREQVIRLLNQHLADTFDLYGQAKQAHWNVKGPQFFQLHELFDKLADET